MASVTTSRHDRGADTAEIPPSFHATTCAICGTEGQATEVYPANFHPDALNPEIFSARRLPDRVHYRMVRCDHCGLIRSDPIADRRLLDALYVRSAFSYDEEVPALRRTYGRYLDRARKRATRCQRLLEIGCGNGFFLEEAHARGVAEVWGVEPSEAAVVAAADWLRPQLVCDVMRQGLFPEDHFDLICIFQVFDHISDPADLLAECKRVLRPGGLVLALNHNVSAVSARLLGERSPIVDIEHTYLYTPDTMRKIFTAAGFKIVEGGAVRNDYSLYYLTRLLPLPGLLKRAALSVLKWTGLGKCSMTVPLGNLYQIARKPE
jgi:SAM-dependent methyltransferase